MLFVLLVLTFSSTYNISVIGYTDIKMEANDILFVNNPSTYHAFVLFSEDLKDSVQISVYRGNKIKTYEPSKKIYSMASHESTIRMKFGKSVYLNIWIIPQYMCDRHAVAIMNEFDMDFEVRPGSGFGQTSCIFSASSTGKSQLKYGHNSTTTGNAYVVADGLYGTFIYENPCLNGNTCSLIESQNFFVVYNNTDSVFSLKRERYGSEDEFKICNAEYVSYATIDTFATDCPWGSYCSIGWTCQTHFQNLMAHYLWLIMLTFGIVVIAILYFVVYPIYSKKAEIANVQPLLETGK